jgi:hypothetical protein
MISLIYYKVVSYGQARGVLSQILPAQRAKSGLNKDMLKFYV